MPPRVAKSLGPWRVIKIPLLVHLQNRGGKSRYLGIGMASEARGFPLRKQARQANLGLARLAFPFGGFFMLKNFPNYA